MKIDCISDLHGYYPELEGGDILIVAGDLTARDTATEHEHFIDWISKQKYTHKIVVAGNHDLHIESKALPILDDGIDYLEDNGVTIEGLKIWGTPWSVVMPSWHPKCKAFGRERDSEIEKYFKAIPSDADILVTHTPPFGILDKCYDGSIVGSKSLMRAVKRINPKLHVFGHIHECGGQFTKKGATTYINAAYCDDRYKPVNKVVKIEL